MAKSLGIYTDSMIIIGLMLSNGIVALCGALIAQNNGYADINMGIGTIVIALASIIIGEVAFGELTFKSKISSSYSRKYYLSLNFISSFTTRLFS